MIAARRSFAFGWLVLGVAAFAGACGDASGTSRNLSPKQVVTTATTSTPGAGGASGQGGDGTTTTTTTTTSAHGGAGGAGTTGTSTGGGTATTTTTTTTSTVTGPVSCGGYVPVAPGAGGAPLGDCDPSCAEANGHCTNGVCTLSDDPDGVAAGAGAKLDQGGQGGPGASWLYPYDCTVFPRGLTAPSIQLDAPNATAVRVRITGAALSYVGYFATKDPVRVALPAASWKAVTAAAGEARALRVEVTLLIGGAAFGPIARTWTIAPGSLRGTIYYETYASPIAGDVGIMKIEPGATKPTAFKTGCGNVCHTASADGSTLVASTTVGTSAAYDLKNAGAVIGRRRRRASRTARSTPTAACSCPPRTSARGTTARRGSTT